MVIHYYLIVFVCCADSQRDVRVAATVPLAATWFQLFVEDTWLRMRRFLAAHMELVSVVIVFGRLCEQATFECEMDGERSDFALYNWRCCCGMKRAPGRRARRGWTLAAQRAPRQRQGLLRRAGQRHRPARGGAARQGTRVDKHTHSVEAFKCWRNWAAVCIP